MLRSCVCSRRHVAVVIHLRQITSTRNDNWRFMLARKFNTLAWYNDIIFFIFWSFFFDFHSLSSCSHPSQSDLRVEIWKSRLDSIQLQKSSAFNSVANVDDSAEWLTRVSSRRGWVAIDFFLEVRARLQQMLARIGSSGGFLPDSTSVCQSNRRVLADDNRRPRLSYVPPTRPRRRDVSEADD